MGRRLKSKCQAKACGQKKRREGDSSAKARGVYYHRNAHHDIQPEHSLVLVSGLAAASGQGRPKVIQLLASSDSGTPFRVRESDGVSGFEFRILFASRDCLELPMLLGLALGVCHAHVR